MEHVNKENINKLLKSTKYDYLLNYYNDLTEEEKESLIEDINSIDFDSINSVKELITKKDEKLNDNITPIKIRSIKDFTQEEKEKLIKLGEHIIKTGKYAVVTMAGGQGTRLNHNGPKGTYKLEINKTPKYIFETFVDKLQEIKEQYDVYIDWYIMTSKENNKATIDFFKQHNFFSYKKEKVHFFVQNELPIFDNNGRILLKEKNRILMGPDGNGGVFKALKNYNIYSEFEKKGIKFVLFTGVDNILVNIKDEFFIGLVENDKKLNGVKSIIKNDPLEKVGVFCKRNNKPSVIEYSEMTEQMRYEKNKDNEYLYGDSNIINHLISIDILKKIKEADLPLHKAIKKLEHIAEDKNVVTSDVIKLEYYIFDYFNYVDDVTIYRVERDKEFAPIKNKEGIDSPSTAIKLYIDKYLKE